MQTVGRCKAPDEVEFEIKITLPLKNWVVIANALDEISDKPETSRWPWWQLATDIRDVVRSAEHSFYGEPDDGVS